MVFLRAPAVARAAEEPWLSRCFRPNPRGVVPGEEGAVTTTTLDDVTARKKKPEPSAEEAAVELDPAGEGAGGVVDRPGWGCSSS
jgi:hypothetical protein